MYIPLQTLPLIPEQTLPLNSGPCIRNETFHSLRELNQGIFMTLELHHDKNFQRKDYSRRELFNDKEKPLLQPLPGDRFEITYTTKKKVQNSYHIVLGEDWHYYSVP